MRKLIGASAAAAVIAGASLVSGIAGGHAFAANTSCPTNVNPSNTDTCTPNTSVQIVGNNIGLTLSSPHVAAFALKTLNGQNQSTDNSAGSNNVTVTDQSGSGNGWNLSVSATQLACTAYNAGPPATGDQGCPSGGDTIPVAGELMSTAAIGTATCATGSTCRNYPTALHSGEIDNGTQTVGTAAQGAGMGQYVVPLGTLSTNLPADLYATTYHTTVTLTLASGPAT